MQEVQHEGYEVHTFPTTCMDGCATCFSARSLIGWPPGVPLMNSSRMKRDQLETLVDHYAISWEEHGMEADAAGEDDGSGDMMTTRAIRSWRCKRVEPCLSHPLLSSMLPCSMYNQSYAEWVSHSHMLCNSCTAYAVCVGPYEEDLEDMLPASSATEAEDGSAFNHFQGTIQCMIACGIPVSQYQGASTVQEAHTELIDEHTCDDEVYILQPTSNSSGIGRGALGIVCFQPRVASSQHMRRYCEYMVSWTKHIMTLSSSLGMA